MFSGIEATHDHPTRHLTALVSFTLQALLVAAALVLPLVHPERLSEAFSHRRIFLPAAQGEPSPAPVHTGAHGTATARTPILVVNRRNVYMGPSEPRPGANDGPIAPGINIGEGSDQGINSVLSGPAVRPIAPPPVHPRIVRVSAMMEGNLLHRIEPRYPSPAKVMGMQGSVLIKAIIGKDGRIERTEVVSGQPLLAHAALDAVRQWRYRPYYLNGMPIEVETQITVNFVLQR